VLLPLLMMVIVLSWRDGGINHGADRFLFAVCEWKVLDMKEGICIRSTKRDVVDDEADILLQPVSYVLV
jgi:hypothetical protein